MKASLNSPAMPISDSVSCVSDNYHDETKYESYETEHRGGFYDINKTFDYAAFDKTVEILNKMVCVMVFIRLCLSAFSHLYKRV